MDKTTVEKSSIEKLIGHLNSMNAKRAAFLLIVSFICYHELLHIRYGRNSCSWLLSDGRYKGNQEWQPYGCMLHPYSNIDTRRCFRYLAFYGKQSYFAFIGDSRIRDLYLGFVKHLQQDGETKVSTGNLEKNYIYSNSKLKIDVEFIWTPYITSNISGHFWKWHRAKNSPSIVVIGSGYEAIKSSNSSEIVLNEYKHNLTHLVNDLQRMTNYTGHILWALQEPINPDKLINDVITNEQIDLYNKAAIEVLFSSEKIKIWWSARLVAQGMVYESPDGIHLASRALQHNMQILLNMYCNDYMNFNDGSCCSSAEPYTTVQLATFGLLTISSGIFCLMSAYRGLLKAASIRSYRYSLLKSEPTEEDFGPTKPFNNYFILFKALSILAGIMAYFFICDRTNFFMKENKYYSEFSFWLPIGYMSTLGLFFTEDSKFTKVMHKDQIDEWKGWMQLVILIYQVTGAGQILVINLHVKVLISAFIFLLGYEQLVNVFQRGDVSLTRLCKKLFELNFMTVTLCLCMNRPYQFYYFIPLLSFWHLTCYAILAAPPVVTAQNSDSNKAYYLYLMIKFIILFSLITILFMSEVFFEKVFVTRPWKALFVTTDDDIHDWWYRWKLDRYTSLYGMLCGVVLLLTQRYNLFDDNNHGNLLSRGNALSATLGSIIGVGCYVTFTFLCHNELDCSEIHSYLVCVPILSYIVLRNISGVLRTRYSTLFAWFGEISLELFVSQYHIWLAADTHGVLVLIPGYPVLNIITTSFIFVCVSHEVHRLTKILSPYAVPTEFKSVLRNITLFLVILIPIGIKDGMF